MEISERYSRRGLQRHVSSGGAVAGVSHLWQILSRCGRFYLAVADVI